MSTSVSALPSGGGVTVIAEHHGQSRQDGHPDPEPESAEIPPPPDPASAALRQAAAPPVPDAEIVPAETLFAATLMANALPPARPTADELRLRHDHGWTPPDSSLRLKDKLI